MIIGLIIEIYDIENHYCNVDDSLSLGFGLGRHQIVKSQSTTRRLQV